MSITLLKIPLNDTYYIKQGDTIEAIQFEFGAEDDIDLEAVGVSIKMQIYDGTRKIIDISNGNGITITGTKTFEIDKVEKEDNTFPFGTFLGDLEITDGDGDRFTYTNVQYTIIKEYTR